MSLRPLRLLLLLGLLFGCAQQPALPDTVILAATKEDFTRFRSDLGLRFPADQLKDFDIATQELQLAAMHRDIATAAGREADMRRAINGQTVHAATVLGWRARQTRFLREAADLQQLLDRDLAQAAQTAATDAPASVTRRIASAREVLAQLRTNLAATEQRLKELAPISP